MGNKTASSLAFLALLLLGPGYLLPFMAVSSFGHQETYSLMGSIMILYGDGHWFLGTVILLFSVFFPIAKVVLILSAASRGLPLSSNVRRKLHKVVTQLGKYSMLDIIVIALLVVIVKVNELVELKIMSGTALFCLAILLSMISGLTLSFSHLAADSGERAGNHATEGAADIPARSARRKVGPYILLASFLLLLTGLGLIFFTFDQEVNRVDLTKKREFMPQLREMIDRPDYYLTIDTTYGDQIKTACYEDTPIGNGLGWQLEPILFKEIASVTVWDQNVLQDTALDRVNVQGLENQGQVYSIRFTGPAPASRLAGFALVILGGGAMIILVIRQLRRMAV